MLKKDLRKKYLEKRNALSYDEVLCFSEKIFKNFILQFKPTDNQNIHIFLSIKKFKEIDTMPLIEYFWLHKINVFVPKISNNKIISVRFTPESQLVENSWGILEPSGTETVNSEFDFVITPLLYCDKKGNRVGYGKGFYDEFFKKCGKNSKKVGVNFFAPKEIISNVSETDVSLDYLVTPEEILSFSETSTSTK